jgi:hypothetical protein
MRLRIHPTMMARATIAPGSPTPIPTPRAILSLVERPDELEGDVCGGMDVLEVPEGLFDVGEAWVPSAVEVFSKLEPLVAVLVGSARTRIVVDVGAHPQLVFLEVSAFPVSLTYSTHAGELASVLKGVYFSFMFESAQKVILLAEGHCPRNF